MERRARLGERRARHPRRRHGGRPAEPRRWRSIWISDVHLGTRAYKAEELLRFLAANECEHLYLVGDVVDGWNLRRAWHWDESHNRVLEALLEKSARGTRVVLLIGNHDEFLRSFRGLSFGGIVPQEEAVHRTADGRELLVIHGDAFDFAVKNARWLGHLGDRAYELAKRVGRLVAPLRRILRLPSASLSDWLKGRVKGALSYVETFEQAVAGDARKRGFDGVVCGHIHRAALHDDGAFVYANDGDWVGSCTALVEDAAGKLQLLEGGRPIEGLAPSAPTELHTGQ